MDTVYSNIQTKDRNNVSVPKNILINIIFHTKVIPPLFAWVRDRRHLQLRKIREYGRTHPRLP